MFKPITKVHVNNGTCEEGKALIDLETINSVSQQPNHYSNKLFDENGKLVSQDLDEPHFEILTNEGLSFIVKRDQYDNLKKDLVEFIEINKVNSHDEEGVALVRPSGIKSIVEQIKVQEKDENDELKVDENGNPIYKPTQFAILRREGKTFFVYEKEYERLVKVLTTTK